MAGAAVAPTEELSLLGSVSAEKLGEQRKIEVARDLLAPVYDWFTEDFDTPDLKEAKSFLDEPS